MEDSFQIPGNHRVRIAILDTGIDGDHPDVREFERVQKLAASFLDLREMRIPTDMELTFLCFFRK